MAFVTAEGRLAGPLAAERGGPADRRLRILLVTPASPWPAHSGGAQRTDLLLEALSGEGEVDLCLLAAPAPGQLDMLAARYRLVGLPPLARSRARRILLALLDRIAPELALMVPDQRRVVQLASVVAGQAYDLVVIRYSATACQLAGLRRRAPAIPWIVDVDDFIAEILTAGAGGPAGSRLRRLLMGLARRAVARAERRLLLRADGLWIAGRRPSWLPADDRRILTLPNISWHRAPPAPPVPAPGPVADLLGVAQYGYAPNREGFDWFIREVWPLVRAARPQARLKLVGNPPGAPLVDRWRAVPGVELSGTVPDVTGHYAAARVAIAPVFRGGGTKIKVVEALALGLPCVCSTHAASAFAGADSLLVTDDPRLFAQHCLDLLGDAARRADLAERGRRLVRQDYSRALFGDRVRTLIRHVAAQNRTATHPDPA
jgi:glycosyltransferase involved in cell wall biosynthesis